MDISTLKTKLQQIGQTRVAAALEKLDPARRQALASQLQTFNPDAIPGICLTNFRADWPQRIPIASLPERIWPSIRNASPEGSAS